MGRSAVAGRLARSWTRWLALAFVSAGCSSGALVLGRVDEAEPVRPGGAGGTSGTVADAAALVDGPSCDPPSPARHYTFDGTGTEVTDRRGGAPGRVIGGATLDGSGLLHLDGVDDYVDLPNGILSGLSEITVAVWARRYTRAAYARLFDFGSTSLGEDPPDTEAYVGRTYLSLTIGTGFVPSGLAVLMKTGPDGETVAASDDQLEIDTEMGLVVAVVSTQTVSLFHGERLLTRIPRPAPLSTIVDQNAWLGRSQYAAAPPLEADYADVRIWDRALPDCAMGVLQGQGPNPP